MVDGERGRWEEAPRFKWERAGKKRTRMRPALSASSA